MPASQAIHRHWVLHRPRQAFEWFDQYDAGEPVCYACGWWNRHDAPGMTDWEREAFGLERAHLVDHARGGGEGFDNLVLLCRPCNRTMPSFGPDDYDAALDWVRSQPSFLAVEQIKAEAAAKFMLEHERPPAWLAPLLAQA